LVLLAFSQLPLLNFIFEIQRFMITGGDAKFWPPPQFGFAFQICTDVFSVRLITLLAGFASEREFQIPTAKLDDFDFMQLFDFNRRGRI
jgi:hypothetical protein